MAKVCRFRVDNLRVHYVDVLSEMSEVLFLHVFSERNSYYTILATSLNARCFKSR